ncbi:putative metal-binding protein [Alkalibacillus flavidus]|uniref:Metal-binding protein n=1 Tax=Alkalibacillus flavidus TaxID=546021 RepID=A0ABV2KW00_9BACI
MAHVVCRHCQKEIQHVADDESLHQWLRQETTESEFRDILRMDETGVLHIMLVCEECEEILAQNPNLFEHDYFIH